MAEDGIRQMLWKKIRVLQKRRKDMVDLSGGKKENRDMAENGMTRWVILILAGILLLILAWPSQKQDRTKKNASQKTAGQNTQDETVWNTMEEYAAGQEKKVEDVLSQVEGVGDVDVMITLAASEEKITLQDEDTSQEQKKETDSSGGSRENTAAKTKTEHVLIEEENGKNPYITQIASPKIEGVVVVAQGAGKGVVDAEIIEAIEALFPIESHKIKVLRKGNGG